MTLSDIASLVSVIGFPLVVVQLVVGDRARAAAELVDQHVMVAQLIVEASNCSDSEFAARTTILVNTLESVASLLNRWLMSVWSRDRWRKFLIRTLISLNTSSKFGDSLRSKMAKADTFPSLRFFVRKHEKDFSGQPDLRSAAGLK